MMILNFLSGRVLVVSTGYYSDRIYNMLKKLQKNQTVYTKLDKVDWREIYKDKKFPKYDWVISCPTETSKALLLPIKDLSIFSKKISARLMLDATGSIGLEQNHGLASVLSFSSCKGIFGITGAAFIAYDLDKIKKRNISFYQDIETHLQKRVTGPYNTILSLFEVMKNFKALKQSVIINKIKLSTKMKKYLIYPKTPTKFVYIC